MSLVSLVRQRYLETIRSTKTATRWKILVLDKYTLAHVQHVLKVYDILEEAVQQIDQLETRRTPHPSVEALYIVRPTPDNVDRIIDDFSPSHPAAYAAAHVCFVGDLPEHLFTKITTALPQHLLKSLVEIYVDFWASESRVFTLRNQNQLRLYYAPAERSAAEAVKRAVNDLHYTAQSIVNVLASIGENPLIRYFSPPTAPIGAGGAFKTHLTQQLASLVASKLDFFMSNNPDFPPKPLVPRARAVLLITDRTMDLAAPLLHEFTYQAMCNDLLPIRDGAKYTHSFKNNVGAVEEKEVVLDEEDDVWNEVRHMHMKDALDKLIKDFKDYAGEYESKFGSKAGSSLNDMKDMLASLDSTRKNKEKLSLHLALAEKCMALFEATKLPVCASVEQSCAVGTNAEGKAPKTLIEDMVPLLDERALSMADKMRIIALYVLHKDGVADEDRRRLFQHSKIPVHEADAVNNLKYLGVDVGRSTGLKRRAYFKQKTAGEDVYDISRYQPALRLMLEEQIADKLDTSLFPYIREAPQPPSARNSASSTASAPGSLRSARPRWADAKKTGAAPTSAGVVTTREKESRQRLMVFVAGGMTYSEIREVYKVSEERAREIFIGSSHVTTPIEFLNDLHNLDRAGGASISTNGALPKELSFEALDPKNLPQPSPFYHPAQMQPQQPPPNGQPSAPGMRPQGSQSSTSSRHGPPHSQQPRPMPPQGPPQGLPAQPRGPPQGMPYHQAPPPNNAYPGRPMHQQKVDPPLHSGYMQPPPNQPASRTSSSSSKPEKEKKSHGFGLLKKHRS